MWKTSGAPHSSCNNPSYFGVDSSYGACLEPGAGGERWIQMDLGFSKTVSAVTTKGRSSAAQWVTKYSISYSNDGATFTQVSCEQIDEDGNCKGNSDKDTAVTNQLLERVTARYVRLTAVLWSGHASIRMGVTTCTTDVDRQQWIAFSVNGIPARFEITSAALRVKDGVSGRVVRAAGPTEGAFIEINGEEIGYSLGAGSSDEAGPSEIVVGGPDPEDQKWRYFNGSRYRYVASAQTWNDAQKTCQGYGGDLVSIRSEEEHGFLVQKIPKSGKVWIGCNDQEKEGTFVWPDGSSCRKGTDAYTRWASGEPNDSTGEDCTQYILGADTWNDLPCSYKIHFICEAPGDEAAPRPTTTTSIGRYSCERTVGDDVDLPPPPGIRFEPWRPLPTELAGWDQAHCECATWKTDARGVPADFSATQHRGAVRFRWADASMCEQAFAVTRCKPGKAGRAALDTCFEPVSFAPDYYHSEAEECSATMAPEGLADNLAAEPETLAIGTRHRYCVEAISDLGIGSQSYSSGVSCAEIAIEFESEVQGRIATLAGDVPVEGVEISWGFIAPNGTVLPSGDTPILSAADGDFAIRIKTPMSQLPNRGSPPALLEQPVRVWFSKSEGGSYKHEFACITNFVDAAPCTSQDLIVHHLAFDRALQIKDVSTTAFAGAVRIADLAPQTTAVTSTPGEQVQEGVGCPLKGVQVCLKDHGSGSNQACVLTNDEGEYVLRAVIGSTVSVELKYRGHTDWQRGGTGPRGNLTLPAGASVQLDGSADLVEVYHIGDPAKLGVAAAHRNIDFSDRTTEELTVELYGSLCKRRLGAGTFELESTIGTGECYRHELVLPAAPAIASTFRVPAHVFKLTIS